MVKSGDSFRTTRTGMKFKIRKLHKTRRYVSNLIIEAENLEEAKRKADLCCMSSLEYIDSVIEEK